MASKNLQLSLVEAFGQAVNKRHRPDIDPGKAFL